MREIRFQKASELRVDAEDGKQYLTGYAANYNVLSSDLGYFRERILPGAFTRALKEKQDVRHLKNHDPNFVLGRTASGTTELSEDSKGLKFRTLLPDTSYARDLAESVNRKDITECSFGFIALKTNWLSDDTQQDQSMRNIRELMDLDLFDVSTVTYPAYPQTNTDLASRSLFPDGVPVEIRNHVHRDSKTSGVCNCECDQCKSGNCAECTNEECDDENCRCMDSRSQLTRMSAGENLPASCFLIVEDSNDIRTWKLPFRFSTEEKSRLHLRNNLNNFRQVKAKPESLRAAWEKLVALCRSFDMRIAPDDELAKSRLSAEQISEINSLDEPDAARAARLAHVRLRAVQASL